MKNVEIEAGKMDRKIAIILSSHQILRSLTETIIVRRISTYYEILIILSMIILYFDFELVLIKMVQLFTVLYEFTLAICT